MKSVFVNLNFYVHKFLHRNSLKKSDPHEISVHYRRDLDALGEYIKI